LTTYRDAPVGHPSALLHDSESLKMKTQKITLYGGFHNAAQIDLRIKDGALSLGQYKRLRNHMCGIEGCVCGWRGYEIEGISKYDFDEMVMNAWYESSMKG